jgi:hypothetical protein
MPRRSNEFQGIVARIYAALAAVDGATVEESALLKERNAHTQREVDVLVTTRLVGQEVRVAIEARDHARDQDITWVDSIIGKYANLPVDRVIAVSRSQFTDSARQKALQHRIELLTLAEAEQVDWVSRVLPKEVRSLVFNAQPMRVVLHLGDEPPLWNIELTFEGEVIGEQTPERCAVAEFARDLYRHQSGQLTPMLLSHLTGERWAKLIENRQNVFVPMEVRLPSIWSVRNEALGIDLSFDRVIWGIGIKFSAASIKPQGWVLGQDTIAADGRSADVHGRTHRWTVVGDSSGSFASAIGELPEAGAPTS